MQQPEHDWGWALICMLAAVLYIFLAVLFSDVQAEVISIDIDQLMIVEYTEGC